MTWVLAHQGGWDEILLVVVPALAAVYALRWAARRAQERSAEAASVDDGSEGTVEEGSSHSRPPHDLNSGSLPDGAPDS